MLVLSPKQRELQTRDIQILEAARSLVLVHGYFGITMDQIARESGCPKGTLYHRFACKEDILVAMAVECTQRRTAMMRRALAFDGRSRERLMGVTEGAALYGRSNEADLQILHTATGPIREKASPSRVLLLIDAERDMMRIMFDLLSEAVKAGDLVPDDPGMLDEMAEGALALLEGGFMLIQDGVPQQILGVRDPFYKLWRYYNRAMDAYGWKPLFTEWNYEESLVRIRQEIYPEEAQALYGDGVWYGDRI